MVPEYGRLVDFRADLEASSPPKIGFPYVQHIKCFDVKI
jgi:hypothetical protein